MRDPIYWFSLYKTNQPPPVRYNHTDHIKPWEPPPLIKNKFARNILITLGLAAGGAIVTASVAGAVYFVAHGMIALALKDRDFKREIKRLEKKGFVSLTKKPEGFLIKLRKKAGKKIKRLALDAIQLPKSKIWDKKWRILIFDIPETNRLARDMLRKKLKDLGMYNIQRSVFTYPYDCRDELDFIAGHYGLEKYTSFAEITYSDLDREMRKFFKL